MDGTSETIQIWLERLSFRDMFLCVRHACIVRAAKLKYSGQPADGKLFLSATRSIDKIISEANLNR